MGLIILATPMERAAKIRASLMYGIYPNGQTSQASYLSAYGASPQAGIVRAFGASVAVNQDYQSAKGAIHISLAKPQERMERTKKG
jgi:hypothetical protein